MEQAIILFLQWKFAILMFFGNYKKGLIKEIEIEFHIHSD